MTAFKIVAVILAIGFLINTIFRIRDYMHFHREKCRERDARATAREKALGIDITEYRP